MSDQTVTTTGEGLRAEARRMNRKYWAYRMAFYVGVLIAEFIVIRGNDLWPMLTFACAIGIETSIWLLANGARHKRNELNRRLLAFKRDIGNHVFDVDGSNLKTVQTDYVYDEQGWPMTPGDVTRRAIQVRDAMKLGHKGKRRILELTRGLTGITRQEMITLAKRLDYDMVIGQVEDLMLEKVHTEHVDTYSKPNLRNVQYTEAFSTAHPEMVAEAARLGMQAGVKNVRVGNGFVDIAVFNHEGADIFGSDDEGHLYLSHGLRWIEATADEINEVLSDLKKVVTP